MYIVSKIYRISKMFTRTFNSVTEIRRFVNEEVETILTIIIFNKINICLYNILSLCNCVL